MSRGLQELLSVTEWVPAHAGEIAYTTGGATETTPAKPTGYDGNPVANIPWRFVRIQAHDGDLIVKLGSSTPGTGDIRVFNGSAEILQLNKGGATSTVTVASTAGTVHGAVIWGR